MTRAVIIDAGPALNFCATSSERILLDVVRSIDADLLTTTAVDTEVLRKARNQQRFGPSARRTWLTLKQHHHVSVLPTSGQDEALARATDRVCGVPPERLTGEGKDDGEWLVIAHALVQKANGTPTYVLMDDGRGRTRARQLGVRGISTEDVLLRAITLGVIANRGEVRGLYSRMRKVDDGLVDVGQTELLDPSRWR